LNRVISKTLGKGLVIGLLLAVVDEDRLIDLVLQVATENLDPESFQDGYAILTGATYDGQVIEGEDEITLISGK